MAPSHVLKNLSKKRKHEDEGDSDEVSSVESSSSSSESEQEEAQKQQKPYKQRVLVLSSRGITQRQRHLMNDIAAMLPHSKKDSKLDTKHQLALINELCDLSNCNNALFFEARRKYEDLYIWAAKAPNGPSVRFHVLNMHTIDELKMTGNCLKGSRPVVVFDKAFDETPHHKIMKEVLSHIFSVPKTSRRVKPFIDHVFSFSLCDNKIWFRNFQILNEAAQDASKDDPKVSLNEVGPRFVLDPVKIFEGSFNGATLYENDVFIPSSQNAGAHKAAKASSYRMRKGAQDEREQRKARVAQMKKDNPLERRKVFS